MVVGGVDPFWSHGQRPRPHSQGQEGALDPESQGLLTAVTARLSLAEAP